MLRCLSVPRWDCCGLGSPDSRKGCYKVLLVWSEVLSWRVDWYLEMLGRKDTYKLDFCVSFLGILLIFICQSFGPFYCSFFCVSFLSHFIALFCIRFSQFFWIILLHFSVSLFRPFYCTFSGSVF